MAAKFYDIANDEERDITQEEVDRLFALAECGGLQRLIMAYAFEPFLNVDGVRDELRKAHSNLQAKALHEAVDAGGSVWNAMAGAPQ